MVVRLNGKTHAEPMPKCRNFQEVSEPVVTLPVTKEKAPHKKRRRTAIDIIQNERHMKETKGGKKENKYPPWGL
jgi:hypothetical protein